MGTLPREGACAPEEKARDRIRPRGCGSDMQAALEVTARHCRKEAEQYGQCVAANPSSWQQDCHQLKLEMAKCTSSHTKKGDLCVNAGVSTGLKVPGSRNGNNVILKIY